MQNPSKRNRLSRSRQSLTQLAKEIHQLLPVFTDRLPLVKGVVYELRRQCGKPTCHCAAGSLHGSMMLSRHEGGRTKLMSIPSDRLKALQVMTGRYKCFRSARSRLGQICKTMLSLIDQMEEARRHTP